MSVPSLTKALHKITIQDVACDKVSFVALLGEDTFSYISRVMGMRGQLHGDVIVAFLDRMQNARAEELFFREVLFNIPKLDIRDGYRIQIEGRLSGKVFKSLCPVKILLYLRECVKRKSVIEVEEFSYLYTCLDGIAECAEKREIEEILKKRALEPHFDVQRVVWQYGQPSAIDESDIGVFTRLGMPAAELFIFIQSHFLSCIQHWSRKSLLKILQLEGKKELLEYLNSAPNDAKIRFNISFLQELQAHDTLLDYKCTDGNNRPDYFELDAEFTKNWQAGPGQKYSLSKIHQLATCALDASNRLLQNRVPAASVFSKTLVAEAVGSEALRSHVMQTMLQVFALYHYTAYNEGDLAKRCKTSSHFSFSYQTSTYFMFETTPKELVVKNNETGAISRAEVPRKLTAHDSLIYSDRISALVAGDQFEMRSVPRTTVQAMADEDWNGWQNEDIESWQLYNSEIHPLLHGAAVSILRASQSEDLVVMEVCGGSGVLAQRICKYVQKPFSYILLERNLDSLQQAKKALHTEKRIQLVQTDVVVEGNFYVDEQKTTEIKEESVALCIGSGALTKSVLNNRPEALIVLDKIIKYLKRGGYLLLAGLTESFLHSNDFIDKGLRVLNTHASGYRPVYIVQKP
ncbi:MAG: hypothetical protein LLF94_01465 [Chlamydiales bacterium]|nr:hypothetical protein [Chlamydiales bacterium]